MHGLFLLNKKKEIAFAQFGSHVKIEGFRYIRDARLCVVIHSTGQEEMFTTEQPEPIAGKLASVSEVLVAHLDDLGHTVDEYTVPVTHTG
jgi:hypothetical protein